MTEEKNCVNVKIAGTEYSFSGYETEEYIRNVCSYVDDKIKEVSQNNPGLSPYSIAVMAGVNISDDFHKKLQSDMDIKKDIETFNNVINDLGTKINILEKENDYLRQVIESLNERIKEYES